MANKRPKPEVIVLKLRQVEVVIGRGKSRIDTIRQIGVTEQTYDRQLKTYGRMGTEELMALKRLQKEHECLSPAVSDLILGQTHSGGSRMGEFLNPTRLYGLGSQPTDCI